MARVDGHGFTATPFARSRELSDELGFSARGGVWVKDETGNVSGSHKARHLFGVLLWLEVAERLGLADPGHRPDLAIASCGNAALAAAVVAAAGERTLRVFVPVDADPAVLARLERARRARHRLPARAGRGRRPHRAQRCCRRSRTGALPFTCQGNLNGLAVEGGETLGYEIAAELAATGATVDHLVVQVGGGALGSACAEALREAAALGAIPAPPHLHTVQTEGAWPLRRAFDAVASRCASRTAADIRDAVAYAAHHRSAFMWPWESEPHSIAHGILDDETYDWLVARRGDARHRRRGRSSSTRRRSPRRTRSRSQATAVPVDPTGSAGLAGLLALRDAGRVARRRARRRAVHGSDSTTTTTGRESR